MNDKFNGRISYHTKATTIVKKIFTEQGFFTFDSGIEIGKDLDDRFYQMIRLQNDPISIMLRFQPDLIVINKGIQSIPCEIKSEYIGYSNFSIEMDSYKAGAYWNNIGNVAIVFVDLSKEPAETSACWINDLPKPRKIFIPRWDRDSERMRKEWGNVELVNLQGKGSGTPYMLVPKESKCFIKLDELIRSYENFK